MSQTTMHCIVRGKVQGVFFRKHTQEQARHLGVKGWVKNLTDGNVEVMVSGDKDAVEELVAWLHQGPPASNVERVDTKELAWTAFADFHIEH